MPMSIPQSRWHQFRSSKGFIYVVVNLAVFIDTYLYGLIIPILPFALAERAHIPPADIQQWIGVLLGAYGVGLVAGSPVAGYLADNSKSRRAIYMLGLIALAVSTVMFSVGHSISVLVIGRLLQGASSAFVHCVGVAILADTVGEAGIGPAMGFITMMIALGMATGPLCGGFLYHKLGYHAVFISAYVLVGIDLLCRVLMLERKSDKPTDPVSSPKYDNSDSNNKIFARDNYGTTEEDQGSQIVSATPSNIGDNPISAQASSKTSTESPEASPLLPKQQDPHEPKAHRSALLVLLATPRMLAAIFGAVIESLILTELESVLPLYLKTRFAYDSSKIGLIFLMVSLPSLGAPMVGILSERYGAKIIVSLGFLSLAPLWSALGLVDHKSPVQVALLCILLFAIGVALDMVLTPVFAEAKAVVDEVEEEEPGVFGEKGAYAQAFALVNMAYSGGSVVGPLLGGMLVQRIGWGNLMLGTGALCLLSVGPCLYAIGGMAWRGKKVAMGF